MDQCLNKWSGGHQFGKIEEDYLKSFKQPERIHATCEDYRAAASIDLEHDRLDRDQLLEIPIQVLWGAKGVVGKQFKPKEIWQKYSSYNVGGCAIDSGHFIPEEKPLDTIKELTNFFLSI
jgi:haloacetate dehalogenase